MGKTNKIDWDKLKEPFPEKDIEWRLSRSGKSQKGIWAMCLAYVTNRAIMDRLDEVVGVENWKNEFIPAPDGGVLCGLSIRINDEWVTKWDGAENTNIDAVKGGLSGAMKRAAVQFGIGRYLYNLEEGFAIIDRDGKFRAVVSAKNNRVDSEEVRFQWDPPILPDWALPENEKTKPKPKEDEPPTYEEMLVKIDEAKALPHLSNIWKKYNGLFKGDEKDALILAKEVKKGELIQEAEGK